MVSAGNWRKRVRRLRRLLMVVTLAGLAGPSVAGMAVAQSTFTPSTKIRVTIIQWIPTKGAYERWDALGGEFIVSDDLTVTLPILGTLPVRERDVVSLAAEISAQLKRRIGLVDAPQATVDIIDRLPVYIIGAVEKPGEYKFHDQMTVLQAVAMSGGGTRAVAGAALAKDRMNYVSELKELQNAILGSEIRLIRLEAESAGAKEMVFDPASQPDIRLAEIVFRNEKAIHQARMNEIDRQSRSFIELRALLVAEIANLEKKVARTDEDIDAVHRQLGKIKELVDKGIMVPARQMELERLSRGYFSDRADLETSIMRARQSIAETDRNLAGLHDRQATEVASALQSERANLDQLKLRRDLKQALLVDAVSQARATDGGPDEDPLEFAIVRRQDGVTHQFVATEATVLEPGDVVRVVKAPPLSAPSVSSLPEAERKVAQQDNQ